MANYTLQLDLILQSNQSELFYAIIGSTPWIDSFYLFAVSPLAFASFAFNTFAFVILLRSNGPDHTTDLLQKYLVVYVLNNAILCLVMSLAWLGMSPRYSPWFYSVFARIHRCILLEMLNLTLLTINRALEVLIICQRLANFRDIYKRIGSLSWTRTYAVIVLVSFFINVPFYRNIKSDAQLEHDLAHFNRSVLFTYCARDMFYNNPVINYSKAVSTFLHELLLLCVELALSVMLIVYFKRFIAAKSLVIAMPTLACLRRTSALMPPPPPQRELQFKRTTRTVAQFSVFSVIASVVLLVFFILCLPSYNNLIINSILAAVLIFSVIFKPIVTILVLYKIDRNVRNALTFRRSK